MGVGEWGSTFYFIVISDGLQEVKNEDDTSNLNCDYQV